MLIEIPNDASTTLAEVLTTLAETSPLMTVVGTDDTEVDVYLSRGFLRANDGVNVLAHPWVVFEGIGAVDRDTSLIIPAELIRSITVH
jgi:hypothetical protein